MNPKAVVVVHREPMVAEGIAVALGIHPGIVPIATSSTVQGLDRYADRLGPWR